MSDEKIIAELAPLLVTAIPEETLHEVTQPEPKREPPIRPPTQPKRIREAFGYILNGNPFTGQPATDDEICGYTKDGSAYEVDGKPFQLVASITREEVAQIRAELKALQDAPDAITTADKDAANKGAGK